MVQATLTISSAEGRTTSPQPAAPPSNQVNGIHKDDKLSQVSHLSSSWELSPLSWYLSICNEVRLTLAITYCLVCLPALVMDEPSYISHACTQSDSHTVGHLWERLVLVIKAQCLAQRESEGRRKTAQSHSIFLKLEVLSCTSFLDCFPLCWAKLRLFNHVFSNKHCWQSQIQLRHDNTE